MKLIVSPEAQEDVVNAARFYETKQKGMGERITSFLEEKIAELLVMPGSHPLRVVFIGRLLSGTFRIILFTTPWRKTSFMCGPFWTIAVIPKRFDVG